MSLQQLTAEEVMARGKAIYENELQNKAEAEFLGQFLVLDIVSKDYEIAESDSVASKELLARQPNAITFGVRIGQETAYKFSSYKVV